jgi:hypothetical protein
MLCGLLGARHLTVFFEFDWLLLTYFAGERGDLYILSSRVARFFVVALIQLMMTCAIRQALSLELIMWTYSRIEIQNISMKSKSNTYA